MGCGRNRSEVIRWVNLLIGTCVTGVVLTHFHNDEVNDEHFPFVIELGDVDPAEVVSPSAVVERGDATVVRPDIQSGPSRVL